MDISVWEKESFFAPCDVLIVGGGLLGLWTARELKIKRPYLKVTLIDKGIIPSGASTRNAGFACFGSPSEMLYDLQVMQADTMWRIVDMRFRGIQRIRSLFPDDQSGFENSGGFECFSATTRGDVDRWEWQLRELNKDMRQVTGTSESFTPAPGKLAGYGLKGFGYMVENRMEGGLHSGRLVKALMTLVKSLGVQVLGGIEMTAYEPGVGNTKVFTAQKVTFSARQVLLATNAFLSKQVPSLGIVPARGQIILSPPIAGLALKGTFHFDEGYYYFRNLGNRVLLGGARNKDFNGEQTLSMETSDIICQALYAFIQQHIPAAAIFPFDRFEKWSGLMAMHPTKQPLLAQLGDGVWAAMCCNGMGVALSPVFSEHVAKAIMEHG